ncbi:MAG TPA: hypothetical protein GXX70_01720, partial [Tepidimicrobium sp.]|nr:hypothetical protein [Tepidimicrobium sp.]
ILLFPVPRRGRKPQTIWFVAFAPYEEPEIAISVVLFQGGSGGYAGPVAREIIAEYMGLNEKTTKGEEPYKTELAR